jgi:magnesium-transporting ATPase (P-type)
VLPEESQMTASPQRGGLTHAEAAQRLQQYGENVLTERRADPLWRSVLTQLTYPLALLLEAAAALAFASQSATLGWTILAVVAINALFAVVQERHARKAVEALRAYLPQEATVLRSGRAVTIEARLLVPDDLLLLHEGQRVSADARVVDGEVTIDQSTITGESVPVLRTTASLAVDEPEGDRPEEDRPEGDQRGGNLLWSGTTCVAGSCSALVTATGDRTELGRISTLSQSGAIGSSPLELQVRRLSRLIALVAVGVGLVFLPLGMVAGLGFASAFLFTIGLLVANVPEGLLPTITLALTLGTQRLARLGAIVKRLSAVQTLGSTTVICTDKTGTLTQNKMTATAVNVAGQTYSLEEGCPDLDQSPQSARLGEALAACAITVGEAGGAATDPTELALAVAARRLRPRAPHVDRRHTFAFAAAWRTSGTVDLTPDGLALHLKGAPESVMDRSTTWWGPGGAEGFDDRVRADLLRRLQELAADGLRVIAVAERRRLPADAARLPREQVERDLCLLGLVGMVDPPRAEVPAAVASCHRAGIRVFVITGDNATTASVVAHRVGISGPSVVDLAGGRLDQLPDEALDDVLRPPHEVICSRSSPEHKLRIASALQHQGEVVAMTGDGVNDAPALHRADIGIAMGRGGTDVAREAADIVLTDDDFSTIVAAVEEGRRIYDNVQKFILYIFAHAVPEVVPFLLFALSGGQIPLGLTVLQILAIDLGTETMPALALAREPAEPGIMSQPPRSAKQSLLQPVMLIRAWGVLGVTSAALAMLAFFVTLRAGGWHPGVDATSGAMQQTYLRATTATFAAIVACQVGTALAARTDRVSLLRIGLASNRLLLWGIAFELVFSAAVIYLPAANVLLGTAPLPWSTLVMLVPFPVLVWGADEAFRWALRRWQL